MQYKSFAAMAMIAPACFAADAAQALTYNDILGNWCSQTARLEFTRDEMGVLLFRDRSHSTSHVTKYEFAGSIVHVYWMKDGKETTSRFGEFTADGKTMFLQPDDNVPHRQYNRC